MTRTRASLAGAAAALIVLATAGLGAAPRADAAAPASGSLQLVSQTAWLAAGGSFDLHLAVDGVTDRTGLDLTVAVHGKVASRSEFQASMRGHLLRTALTQATMPLDEIPTDVDGNLFVSLPLPRAGAATTGLTLPDLDAGVYPVRVTLRHHQGTTIDRLDTQLVRLPDRPPVALDVAWVQPVSAPVAVRPDGHTVLDDRSHQGVASITAAIAANRQIPMTLDVTPDTALALDAGERQTLRDILDDRHPLLASPFVPVDASALDAAGHGADLALQRQVGANALLATLGDRGDPRTWSATRTLTSGALVRLRALGVTRVVVPESALEPLPGRATGRVTITRPYAVAAGEGTVVQGIDADADLSSHFRSTGDQVLHAHQLLADLAVLFLDAPGVARGVVIRPPATWRPSGAFLGTVLPALTRAPILRPVSLDRLFDDVQPLDDDGTPLVRTPAALIRDHRLPAAHLDDAHRSVAELVTLLGTGSEQAEVVRRRLLAGEAIRLSRAARDAVLDSIPEAFDQIRGRLQLPSGRTIRLTAREATIPLTVVNRNPFPVVVDLVLSSEKLDFRDVHTRDRSREVLRGLVLSPGAHTRAIPVRARVSATFSLRAALAVPDGREIARSRFTIVSTVFSGVGIVLSIGAALFLLLWWGRHWRTVRRGRRLVEPAH